MTCPDCNSKINKLKEIDWRINTNFPSQFYPTKKAIEDNVNESIKKGELLCRSCAEKSNWKVDELIRRAKLGDSDAQGIINSMRGMIENHGKKYVQK